MYGMVRRMTGRMEVRLPGEEREEIERAAELDGLRPSTWARRVLKTAALSRIARARAEPQEPTAAAVEAALKAYGAMKGERGRRFAARVAELKGEPWTVE